MPAVFTVTNLLNAGVGSLRDRIAQAAASSGDDTINFQPGLSGTVTLAAQLQIADPSGRLTIDGPGAGLIALSGNDLVRILRIDPGSRVSIDDLTLRNGRATDAADPVGPNGGAIHSRGELRLARCTLTNNTASEEGGALFWGAPFTLAAGGTMTLELTGNTFSTNTAVNGGGAALNYEASAGSVQVLLQGTNTFVGNRATSATPFNGYGGGLYVNAVAYGSARLRFDSALDSTTSFQSNMARYGGGLAMSCYAAGTSTNDTVLWNLNATSVSTSAANQGGGAWLETLGAGRAAQILVLNSTFSQNRALTGSGVYTRAVTSSASGSSTVAYFGCAFNNNSFTRGIGGGAYLETEQGAGAVTPLVGMANCTVAHNSAETGAGVCARATGADPVSILFFHVTIARNSAFAGAPMAFSRGGGLYVAGGTPLLSNTLIAHNSVSAVPGRAFGPDVFGTVFSHGTNLIGNTASSSGWGATDILNVTPLLGLLQDNGGPTQTIPLLAGSRGIDEGTDLSGLGLTTDQRGTARPQGPRVDIGAFEFV